MDFSSILMTSESRASLCVEYAKVTLQVYFCSFMETEIRADGSHDVFFVDVFCLSLLCTFCTVCSAEVLLCQPVCGN